jgi:hypothetical protein
VRLSLWHHVNYYSKVVLFYLKCMPLLLFAQYTFY